MKTFFKVMTVSTMGLLFVMTNDVVAADAAAAESPSPLACLLAPPLDTAFAASGKAALPVELSTKVWEFLGASDLANLARACRDTHAISVPKIQTMTVPEFRAYVITPRPFDETIALRITAGPTDSWEAVADVLRGITHTPYHLQFISLDFQGQHKVAPEICPLIEAIGSRLESLTIECAVSTPLSDRLLPALTNLKRLELTCFTLSEATLAQLIAKIDGGCHVKLLPSAFSHPLNLRLWQHIVRPGTTCDLESIADAHQRLGNEPGIPYATNPHALAILRLGLPEDNQYVVWAHERLAGKHNKRTMTIRTESGFLLGISPPTF